MSKIKVWMGVPSTGTRCDAQVYALRDIAERYSDRIELVYPNVCVHRIFHDHARNKVVEEFLESDCDVLWFLDSDIAPPKHVLDLLTFHWDEWQVAGAPYPVFMQPPGETTPQVVFCVYKGTDGKGLAPGNIPMEGTEFVDGAATGCLFIKRSVLKDMPKPYFEFKYHPETRDVVEGEDIGFCKKLVSAGIKTFVDYSMVCKHYKNVCLLDVNNYATTLANKAVARYDQTIRSQVEALAARYKAKDAGQVGQGSRAKSKLILPPNFG